MKTEIRKVTVEQEVFIACDGVEFTDRDDCESYELTLKEKALTFYDYNLKRCDFDSCMYVKLDTSEHIGFLRDVCKWNGVTTEGLENIGVYIYYDGYKSRWINWTSVFNTLMERRAEDEN